MCKTRRTGTALLLLGLAALLPAAAQAPATNAPATNAPASATPVVPLSAVITAAATDSATLQDLQQRLATDATAATVQANLTSLTTEVDQHQDDTASLLQNNPPLPLLRNAAASWQMISDDLADSKKTLSARLTDLDARLGDLAQMKTKWQATQAQSTGAPAEVLGRISAVITATAQTTQAATDLRARLLLLQNSLENQDARINTALGKLKQQQEAALNHLFSRDGAPLWEFGAAPDASAPKQMSLSDQLVILRNYGAQKYPTFFLHLALFLVLAIGIFAARGEVRRQVAADPDMAQSAAVFEVPLATALVLALFAGSWLYPLEPALLQAGLGVLGIVPIIIVLHRLLEADLFVVLYALVAAYFVDHLRLISPGTSWAGRAIFFGELLAGLIFLIWLLRSRKLSGGAGTDALRKRFVRIYARVAALLLGAALIADFLGYLRLSYLLGTGLLNSSYLLVIVVAAVRIMEGLILGAIKLPPVSYLGMVRNHYPLLRRRLAIGLRWIAFGFWLWRSLDLFSVRAWLWQNAGFVLTASHTFGTTTLSLGRFILFGLVVWGTFLLSRLVRFVLEEEVYPQLRLGPGVPYATSTIVHYVILVVGLLWALPLIGVNLGSPQFAILGGALGVGLGFGLQNILNNFVSGIILLFERPIKVGDIIQVDVNVGTVEKIGIRASILRLTNGSEYILPNGNLISNPVINWTFSDRHRVIDLPVVVAAKADPHQVMGLLINTAKANPLILKDPPPHAIITTLSGASLNFELRVWTDSSENWLQVRSDLALAVSAALARENITMT